MSAVEITSERAGDVGRIEIAGELDITGTEPLGAAVDAALASGAQRVLIDLGRTSFIDSTGLALLLQAERAAHAADRPLRVVAPAGSEARVFVNLAGLGRVLDLAQPDDPWP